MTQRPHKPINRHNLTIHSDYEVLEWSPTLGDNEGSDDETYVSQVGRGIREGRWITFTLNMTVNSLGSLTGGDAVRIQLMPYPFRNLSVYNPVFPVYGTSLAITDQSSLVARGIGGSSNIVVYTYDLVTGASILTITELSAAGSLQISGRYETDDVT